MNHDKQGTRLHFSSVITATLKGVGALIFILLLNFTEILSSAQSGEEGILFYLIAILSIVAMVAIVFFFNLFRWLKTYTYFEDTSFVVSRRLIMQNITTVKLSSIASVNLKQTLFDRIFGTYTLQLDINSTATANKTDFHLVFAEEYALELKNRITSRLSGDVSPLTGSPEKAPELIHSFPLSKIIRHGFLSIPLTSIALSIALIVGVVTDLYIADPTETASSSFLLTAIFVIQIVFAVLAPFFRYYNFTLSRKDGKVIISHGLITRSEYTLPLSKTSAVILRQPLLARLFGLYYGEILNVGMGDEEKKASPLFCLLCDPHELHSILSQIAPEFVITAIPERSPRSALLPIGLKYGILAALSFVISTIAVAWPLGVFTFLFFLLCGFLSWRTKELCLQDNKISIATGIFAKRIITVPYSRLQNILIRSGPVCAPLGLAKGRAVILSEATNRINLISYFPAPSFDHIMQKMIEQRGSQI